MDRAVRLLGAAVCAFVAMAAHAEDVPYIVAGGRGVGICALAPQSSTPDSDLLDAVLGSGNVDDPITVPGVAVEGDCRPGFLFGGSSTAVADPVGPPTAIVLDVRPVGVIDGRSEFRIPGSSIVSGVASSPTDYVAWLLPFDPTALGDANGPAYDWSTAGDGQGAANLSGSIVTAYTDDTNPTDGGSTTTRIPPSVSSATNAARIQLTFFVAVYNAGDRCLVQAGNPGGCVDPFSNGYAGRLLDPNEFPAGPLQAFNQAALTVGQEALHTVLEGAPVLGVLELPLDLVSVSARSRIPNPTAPLGGFSSPIFRDGDARATTINEPFFSGDLAGVAAGAFLNGDLTTDLDEDELPDTDAVHAQYVVELGFRPLSMLRDPPILKPLPSDVVADSDGDGVADAMDNCPTVPNSGQGDLDEDQVGDACDNCPDVENFDQADFDADEAGDECDNCRYISNNEPDDPQRDTNEDGIGDACQCGDVNGNGVVNTTDALLIARGQVTDPLDLARCDVSGDAGNSCNTTDALLIARGQAPATPEEQTCPAYTGE